MTKAGRRDKESCAGDHRKRTETPTLGRSFGDLVTLARRWPVRKALEADKFRSYVSHRGLALALAFSEDRP